MLNTFTGGDDSRVAFLSHRLYSAFPAMSFSFSPFESTEPGETKDTLGKLQQL